MTDVVGSVRRGDESNDRTIVGAIDLLVVVSLLLVGHVSHGFDPVADPVGAAETVAPFLIGWIVAASLGTLYADRAFASVGRVARTVALHWLAAANVGLVLRASPWFDGGIQWAFPLVITGFGLVALVGWRATYVVVRGRAGGDD